MRKTNTIGTGTIVQEKGEMNVFKKSKRLIPLFMAAMMLTTAIGASAQELPKDPDWESKIDQELKAAMEKADEGEKIPVAVWLRDETVLETVDRRLKEEKNLDPEVFEDQEKFQTEVVDKVTEKLEAQLGVEEANKKKLPTIIEKNSRAIEVLAAADEYAYKPTLSEEDMQYLKLKDQGKSPIDKAVVAKSDEFIMEKRKLNEEEFVKNSDNVFTTHGIQPEELTFQSKYTSMNIVNLKKSQIKAIAEDARVESLECYETPNLHTQMFEEIDKCGAGYARDILNITGAGVKIGVLELGQYNNNNPMLEKAISDGRLTYLKNKKSDITDENYKPQDENGNYLDQNDLNMHATYVTSTIIGDCTKDGNRFLGVVPDATVLQTSVQKNKPFQSGLELLVDNDVKLINMSIGNKGSSEYNFNDKYVDEITVNSNVLCIVAAGNSSQGPRHQGHVECPALSKNALSVANLNTYYEDEPYWGSDGVIDNAEYDNGFGGRYIDGSSAVIGEYKPDVAAPGCMRYIMDMNSPYYTLANGTSIAAPVVTGIAAQVLAELGGKDAPWNPTLVKSIILTGANPYGIDEPGEPYDDNFKLYMGAGDPYDGMPFYKEASGAGVVDAVNSYFIASKRTFSDVEIVWQDNEKPFTKTLTIPWGGTVRCSFVCNFYNRMLQRNFADLEIKDAKTGKVLKTTVDNVQVDTSSVSKNNVQVLEYHNDSAERQIVISVKPHATGFFENPYLKGTLSWKQ